MCGNRFVRSGDPRGRSNAFTLVELLVVIGIIALLISILLPALNRVRASAVAVQCLSNLRQVGVGFRAYAETFNGWLPSTRGFQPSDPANSSSSPLWLRAAEVWPDLLMETRFLPDNRSPDTIARYGGSNGPISESVVAWPNAFSCPGAGLPELGFTGGSGIAYSPGVATTRFAYGMRSGDQDFFKRNGNVENWALLDGRATRSVPGVNRTFGGQTAKIDDVAENVPLVADSIILNSSFNELGQPDTFQTRFPNAFSNFIHRRHNKRANCLFVDGSVIPMARRELRAIRSVNNQFIYSHPMND
jgi:prepilin-type processing-associated H-X9-DG protein/prepilin-type N-terminal cleavage/methylation domain-containing protein